MYFFALGVDPPQTLIGLNYERVLCVFYDRSTYVLIWYRGICLGSEISKSIWYVLDFIKLEYFDKL